MKFNVGDRIVSKWGNKYEVAELSPHDTNFSFPVPVYHIINSENGKSFFAPVEDVDKQYSLCN